MNRSVARLIAIVVSIIVVLAGFRAVVRARSFQLFGDLVARVETLEPVVALTFDDGPAGATLDDILDTLAASGVHATFFVVGNQLEVHLAAGQRLVAAGHELGNHSYSHQRMLLTSPGTAQDEVKRTDSLIRAAGHSGPILFRPPYGVKFVGLPWYLQKSGRTSITWDIEPESYTAVASSPAGIVSHVVEKVRPGSIILLHPWYSSGEQTRQAVPGIIKGVRELGMRFVTMSELLRLRGTS